MNIRVDQIICQRHHFVEGGARATVIFISLQTMAFLFFCESLFKYSLFILRETSFVKNNEVFIISNCMNSIDFTILVRANFGKFMFGKHAWKQSE